MRTQPVTDPTESFKGTHTGKEPASLLEPVNPKETRAKEPDAPHGAGVTEPSGLQELGQEPGAGLGTGIRVPVVRPTAGVRRRRKKTKSEPYCGWGVTGTRRVAVYTRRSTDEEHQPFSIDAQRTALKSYAASQPGWTVVAQYTDNASGAKSARPGLQQALADARSGAFDVLLVYRVDRFARRLSLMLELMGELEQAKVAFCSATESFDTSTPIGRMLVQLLGVFAEFE